jgi:hypothetical protein
MSLNTRLLPSQITFMLMILCSLSLAQAQLPSVSATTEEGEKMPSEMVISGVSPDFASPRYTINTFLLNMDNMFVPLLRRAGKLLIVAFALIYTSKALNGHLVSIPNGGLTGDAVENVTFTKTRIS